MPRGRRSQTTPRLSTSSTVQSGSVPETSVFHKESANVIAMASSGVSPSQCNGIIEANPRKSETKAKAAIVEEPLINHKQDVLQQRSNSPIDLTVSQDASPTSTNVETIETMAEAKTANGSKTETTLNSCDKDYNEDKEFQRASKVNTHSNRLNFFHVNLFMISMGFSNVGNKSSQPAYY